MITGKLFGHTDEFPTVTWRYRLKQKPNGKHGANNANVKKIH
jgi:hypothetical protein